MEIELTTNLKGKCLIAMPGVQDEVFAKSVVYITEHNSVSGAIGVIINRDLANTDKRISANFDFSKYDSRWSGMPFYFGGPVEFGSGFILHDAVDSDGLALTGDRHKIHELASAGSIRPWMITAGYCLWGSFQLEREIKMNSWLMVDRTPQHFLTKFSPQNRYQEALRIAGVSDVAKFDFNGAGNA